MEETFSGPLFDNTEPSGQPPDRPPVVRCQRNNCQRKATFWGSPRGKQHAYLFCCGDCFSTFGAEMPPQHTRNCDCNNYFIAEKKAKQVTIAESTCTLFFSQPEEGVQACVEPSSHCQDPASSSSSTSKDQEQTAGYDHATTLSKRQKGPEDKHDLP